MGKRKSVLVYGTWPDPRTSGISSVLHDVIKELNKDGRDVYLVTQDWANLSHNPRGVLLMQIPAEVPFTWQEATEKRQTFLSLEDLLEKNSQGALNCGRLLLRTVGLIHSHSDDLIPHYNLWERHSNNYTTLVDHIQKLSGARPKLVRTRHDEIYAAIDRLNRLAGIDWEALPEQTKLDFLNDGRQIKSFVDRNILENRNTLKQNYHLDDDYLDHAIDHVWYVLHQIRLWRKETEDFDVIVNLTKTGAEETKKLTLVDESLEEKFRPIYNGTSFQPKDWIKVQGLLHDYHVNKGLSCYRGSSGQKEPISFKEKDKKIIFVGRKDVDKGARELVESLAQLYWEGHTNIKGIFVGDFGEKARKELEAIDPVSAKEYLFFTGKIDDEDVLASIYAFGNVTVLPSHYDTFNLVAAESLHLGKPLIVTDCSGIGDAYLRVPGEHNTQVALPVRKPHLHGPSRYFGIDTQDLAEKIRTIVTDDSLAWKLGENGKRFAKEYLTSERMGKDYVLLFNELLGSRKEKKHIAFFCTTTENTHGVPVVMNNIVQGLAQDEQYEVSFIINSFDDNTIKYKDTEGKEHTFRNREEFVQFVHDAGIKIDILHSHTWHISDYYKPFHTERDNMDLPTFLKQIGAPKLVYTTHANPTEDLRKIKQYHSIAYEELAPQEKERFLYNNLLDFDRRWEFTWEATSILSKKQIMELADVVTFVSERQMHEEEAMIPRYHFEDKAVVVMNGVDMGLYNTSATHKLAEHIKHKELQISDKEKVILYAGRMAEEKGIYDLAEAVEIMVQNGDKKITVIYQSSNGQEAHVMDRILKKSPHVRSIFKEAIGTDERQRMAAMYVLADVVTQPTWGECFNQIGAEALAMGTPVVISDFSAPGEIYVRSGAALGSQVHNPTDLADKLTIMLNDQQVRQRTVEAGQKLVRDKLNLVQMAKEYMDIYQTLLDN